MISVSEAWKLILENVPTMPTESVELQNLSGRVLAGPIHSPFDLPIFTNSAVDGYALRCQDTNPGASLTLAGITAAGDAPAAEIGAGQTVRIFTGSPLPPGADAVVMQEDIELNSTGITLSQAIELGSNVRMQGEELKKGALVLEAGALINPAVLSVLASLGLTEANVYKRPRVAIIGTGNELVKPGQELRAGQIYESNTFAVSSAVNLSGGVTTEMYSVKDQPDDVLRALTHGLENADIVMTCGGVSVGDHDLVRESAAALGVKEIFWRVAMRPGKPFYFGLSPEGQPVFGLPGNPVSALVTFYVLVRPALRKMIGLGREEAWHKALLAAPLKKQKGREEFVRARVLAEASEFTVVPNEGQGSHMLTGLSGADYLIHLPEFRDRYEKDDAVYVKKLTWGLV